MLAGLPFPKDPEAVIKKFKKSETLKYEASFVS